MRQIGLFLIILGSLGGALIAVLDPDAIEWSWFVPCLIVGIIGVITVQIGIRRVATDTTRTQTNFQILRSSLGAIVSKLGELDADKATIDVYELPERIDRLVRADIEDFVGARESIAHACGMQAYADVMSHFAAGERYLNRVWSCSADGYATEAHLFIGRSHEQFAEASTKLAALVPVAAHSG